MGTYGIGFGIQFGKNEKLLGSVSNTQTGSGNGGGGNFYSRPNGDDTLFQPKKDIDIGSLFDVLEENNKINKIFSICF
jgi:hypothetical protein